MAASLSTTTTYGVAAAASPKLLTHHSPNEVINSPSLKPFRRRGFPLLIAKSPSRQRCLTGPSAVSGSQARAIFIISIKEVDLATPRRKISAARCSTSIMLPPSSGTETSAVTEGTTDSLDSVLVYDLNGNGIPISDLWKDRKALVAFARHFGCVLCRTRAAYLAAEKDKMDAAGVALVLIGPGSVDQAKAFSEQTKFKGEVYADPSHASYDALKFVSGVTTTFTPGAGLKIIQAYLEGYRQDWELSFEKDTRTRGGWRQGGIIVAGPGKHHISYIHKDKEAGDDPEMQEILKACCLQSN